MSEYHPEESGLRKLTRLQEILTSMSAYQTEEDELSSSLTVLLSDIAAIRHSLIRMESITEDLCHLRQDTWSLNNIVSSTAGTATRISQHVQHLDEEMSRIKEAGDHVSQVLELRGSLIALRDAIENQDWESATRHCARAMSVPSDVMSGRFAETVIPTESFHLPPANMLQISRNKLLDIYTQEFSKASHNRDSASTTRFFKMFPAIGCENEGLAIYSQFIAQLVKIKVSPVSGQPTAHHYVISLTALLENIATIVDQHQPIVDKYYGKGRMKRVIKHILWESDKVIANLLNNWEDERSLKSKLVEISNPAHSPFASMKRSPVPVSESSTLDPRDIDRVTSELTAMVGRWNLFKLFIMDSFLEPADGGNVVDNDFVVTSTHAHRQFERLVTTYYIPFEVWYMKTIIDKAHRLAAPDWAQLPITTTTPDDVFYVFKVIINRLLSTGSVAGVSQSLERLREVIEQDYIGLFKKKLDDIHGTGSMALLARTEKAERECRFSYIVTLNDLDLSHSHLDQLLKDILKNSLLSQHFSEMEQAAVSYQISSLCGLKLRLLSTIRSGAELLFAQFIRPKMRGLISDMFKDISYMLDDDSYSSLENQDTVKKRLVKSWESLAEGYKDFFTENNYRLFFGMAIDALLQPLEKAITHMKFSELGAIRFDRDLRAVISFLTSQIAFGDVRTKFARLQQMSMLLNLDSGEDLSEIYNASGITWKLDIAEAKAVIGLRV
ncbi:hypothetical protein AMATHDRAFT_71881, partial [Amanita thiersii Skay4041]